MIIVGIVRTGIIVKRASIIPRSERMVNLIGETFKFTKVTVDDGDRIGKSVIEMKIF